VIEYLNFLATTVRFDIDADADAVFAPIRRFFRHVLSDAASILPTFHVHVHLFDARTHVPPEVWSVEPSVIRRSNAKEFNFDAHVVDRGGRRLYANRATLLDTPRDVLRDNVFELWITTASAVQVLDFVRDLVIRHEESIGTVVLHASGLRDADRTIAIAGPKGAGKTTTLLSALRSPNWTYFTGDKLFCEFVGDEVHAHPWRDYPYVGVGTILADRRLTELVVDSVDADVASRPMTDKILIDPDVFESWLGVEFSADARRLAAVFLPEVRPGEPLRTWRVTEDNERWSLLNKIIDRQADTTFFGWQSYLVPDYAAFFASLSRLRGQLDGIPMIRLRGTLDVDPDIVLGATSLVEQGGVP
jgi:hypothetical protein